MSKERDLLVSCLDEFQYHEVPCSDLIRTIRWILNEPEHIVDVTDMVEQEPVAWIIETEIYGKLSEWVCTDKKHYMEAHDGTKDPIPLYTAPPTRKPLSDGEIRDGLDGKNGFENWYDDRFVDGVRFAEKHHGIGGEE